MNAVNVLEIMDRERQHAAAYRLAHGYVDGSLGDAVREAGEARSAVAELIAACDAEQMVINDYLLNTCKETWEAYLPAMMRRRAALARVKGEQA